MNNEMILAFNASVALEENRNSNNSVNWDFVMADMYMDFNDVIMADEKSFIRDFNKMADAVEDAIIAKELAAA